MKTLITRKVGMTSIIGDDGTVQAVTILSVDPNVVTQVKTTDSDGYNAVQVGFSSTKKNTKPIQGHLKKSKAESKLLREFRVEEIEEDLKVGDKLTTEVFEVGDSINVVSTSKGKGWAGTIKRHNFHRGRKTHGGRSYRRVGSIGSMYPQKIFKGKKMAGQLGGDRVTVRNLTVALVDAEKNVIGVKGAVPGPRKSIVMVEGN
ncbi:MAG TPA: 50S ribosomal protein L3 [Candidatus Saccharimonadales bacterium]|nr:50S ribosomal protein L3 [Candidatus Saccharimonadales bacterium]